MTTDRLFLMATDTPPGQSAVVWKLRSIHRTPVVEHLRVIGEDAFFADARTGWNRPSVLAERPGHPVIRLSLPNLVGWRLSEIRGGNGHPVILVVQPIPRPPETPLSDSHYHFTPRLILR